MTNDIPASISDGDDLQFLLFLGKPKEIVRTGWTRYPKITRPESVADHSFRVAMMGMFLAPQLGIDHVKVTRMLLLHDLGEATLGDIVTDAGTYDLPNHAQKLIDERDALLKILGTIHAEKYIELFDEFVANKTPEAQLAVQLDKLEMGLQAREYEIEYGVDLSPFYDSVRRRLTDPRLMDLFEQIVAYKR